MKNQNMINTITTALLALGFAALCATPKAFGVVPAPDGGYPGGNTAEGSSALLSRTTGLYNTAVGIYSVLSLTDGNFCTGVGAGTLLVNTADQNTATGAGALLSNTTGTENTANGAFALFSNTIGFRNTANGSAALEFNTTGNDNTAIGNSALYYNTEGDQNTATGFAALYRNTEGNQNTAIGYQALNSNTQGLSNTANGVEALLSNTTGGGNTANGRFALYHNSTGFSNTALGVNAGFDITGSGNVCIGAGVLGVVGVNDTTWIKNISTTPQNFVAGTNNYVTIRMSDGRLGFTAVVSSRRYKEDIKPMEKASEALLALKPVTFRLKDELDPSHRPQWGLIAEEVEKVTPDLVDRNNTGEVESVRYDQVNAMLLNEFLKEHRKVQEQDCKIQEQEATIIELKSTVAQHQKGMEILTAQIKRQAAQIQKVSARVEANRLAPRLASNKE